MDGIDEHDNQDTSAMDVDPEVDNENDVFQIQGITIHLFFIR